MLHWTHPLQDEFNILKYEKKGNKCIVLYGCFSYSLVFLFTSWKWRSRTLFLLTPVAVHPLDWPPLGNRTRQSHEYQDFGQNLLFISNKETANFDGMDNLNCCRNEVRKVTGTSPLDAESLIKNWPIAPLLIGNCTASRTQSTTEEKKIRRQRRRIDWASRMLCVQKDRQHRKKYAAKCG